MTILIIGLGSIAKKHIAALRKQFGDCMIYALRSSANNGKPEGVINIYTVDEIPEDIDFSIISNPTSKHDEAIRILVELGKPILIEKPVLSTLDNAEELKALIVDNGVVTYVGCNLRFHPAILRLKEEMGKRRPIEMNVYCGSYLPDWRPNTDYREIYSAKASLGGGVHLDLIHELDYSIYLLGMPDNVQAFGGRKSQLEIDSWDVAHYILEYDNSSVFITTNYYRRKAKREIECVWEDGTWTTDLLAGTITNDTGEVIFSCEFDMMDTYNDQLVYFWRSIQEQRQPMNSFDEAVDVLKICLN